jgi:hypothetical protein
MDDFWMSYNSEFKIYLLSCEHIYAKIDQSIRIRKKLVVRKLKLFEWFNALDLKNKRENVVKFFEEYRKIMVWDTRVIEIFTKGSKKAKEIVDKIKHDCTGIILRGKYRKYITSHQRNQIVLLANRIDEAIIIVDRYEYRLKKENKLLVEALLWKPGDFIDEGIKKIDKVFSLIKEEITYDLKFMKKYSESVESETIGGDKLKQELIESLQEILRKGNNNPEAADWIKNAINCLGKGTYIGLQLGNLYLLYDSPTHGFFEFVAIGLVLYVIKEIVRQSTIYFMKDKDTFEKMLESDFLNNLHFSRWNA